VTCLGYDAWATWTLGYPERALAVGREAIDLARKASNTPSLAAALVFVARLHQFRRETGRTRRHAEAAMKLAGEQGFAQRLAAATILFGWTQAMDGAQEGIETMSRGLDDFRATGAADDLPYWLALRAERRIAVRQYGAASGDLDEALALVAAGGPRIWAAELHRLRGELAIRQDCPRLAPTNAEAAFEEALAIARSQQARAFELRAAVSLARWWRDDGRIAQARGLLEPVRARFTEGFDTADLIEADTLLRGSGAAAGVPVAPAPG
jgi:predicted ATPase